MSNESAQAIASSSTSTKGNVWIFPEEQVVPDDAQID